jgi:hypothetical protein
MNIATRLTSMIHAQYISGEYCGPKEIEFRTDCLMELGEDLPCYLEYNISREKLEDPGKFDPDFMFFLMSVKTNEDDQYCVTYSIDESK